MPEKKKLIELTMEIGKNHKRKYTGRFLGFIKDDEFNALVQSSDDSKELAHKIESKETKPLIDICSSMDDLVGHRLVMTIKKINDVNVPDKKLFVSEKLHYVHNVGAANVDIFQEDSEELEIKEI
jgi:hypothetical protein